MKLGEVAKLKLDPAYAYGADGDTARGVPPNSVIVATVKLVSFENEKESWELTSKDDKIAAINERRMQGNAFFGKKDFSRAAARYESAIKLKPYGTSDDDEAVKKELLTSYTNLAACKLKMKDYDGCFTNCEEALKIDPSNSKAIFRRGAAKSERGDWDAAVTDFQAVLKSDPKNKSALAGLRKVQIKIKEHAAKEKRCGVGSSNK